MERDVREVLKGKDDHVQEPNKHRRASRGHACQGCNWAFEKWKRKDIPLPILQPRRSIFQRDPNPLPEAPWRRLGLRGELAQNPYAILRAGLVLILLTSQPRSSTFLITNSAGERRWGSLWGIG